MASTESLATDDHLSCTRSLLSLDNEPYFKDLNLMKLTDSQHFTPSASIDDATTTSPWVLNTFYHFPDPNNCQLAAPEQLSLEEVSPMPETLQTRLTTPQKNSWNEHGGGMHGNSTTSRRCSQPATFEALGDTTTQDDDSLLQALRDLARRCGQREVIDPAEVRAQDVLLDYCKHIINREQINDNSVPPPKPSTGFVSIQEAWQNILSINHTTGEPFCLSPATSKPKPFDDKTTQLIYQRPAIQNQKIQRDKASELCDTAGDSTPYIVTPNGVNEQSTIMIDSHPHGCKPCAFFWTKGCANGKNCEFCHEWHPPKKKKPMKDQKNLMIIARPDGKIEFLRCSIEEALRRS